MIISNIVNLEDYKDNMKPHKYGETMCLNCLHRVISVFAEDIWLKDLTCPRCKSKGYLILTGQEIKDKE